MKSLESLERRTPEFQRLTNQQQQERRELLSVILNGVLTQPSALGLNQDEATRFVFNFLEFHLTGRIERFEKKPKNSG